MQATSFWTDESGQDLIEYTLLLAMITLASGALVYGGGDAVHKIWGTTEDNLTAAKSASS